MKKINLILLLCFLIVGVACTTESENQIIIDIREDSYQFDDKAIEYILINNSINDADCSSYGYLERKSGDSWEVVPSTKPDPVAWCGTLGQL